MNPTYISILINAVVVAFGCGVVYQKISTHNKSIESLSKGMISTGTILENLNTRVSVLEDRENRWRQ